MSDELLSRRIDRDAAARTASVLAQQRDPEGRADRERLAALLLRIAEGGDLRDLADDPEARLVVEAFTVRSTADQHDEAADVPPSEVAAVLDRLVDLERVDDLAAACAGTAPAPAEPRYRQAGLALLYAAVGGVLLALGQVDLAIVFLFLLGPMLLVGMWSVEVLRAARPNGYRAPQTAAEWAADLARFTDRVRARAEEFDAIGRRVRRVDAMLDDLQRRCLRDDANSAGRRLASIRRQLGLVQQNASTLADLLTEGVRGGERFVAQWYRDPAAAYVDFGHLPYAIDPGRIAELTRPVVLLSRLCADGASDVLLDLPGRTAATTAGEISTELGQIVNLAQLSSRRIRNDCRNMIRAADHLHSVVAAVAINELDLRRGEKRIACAAVAASALTRSVRNRATIRTVFIQELSRPSVRGERVRPPIGRATMVAISRGRT